MNSSRNSNNEFALSVFAATGERNELNPDRSDLRYIIRNATRITNLVILAYVDVMHMKFFTEIIPPATGFSDVMIT